MTEESALTRYQDVSGHVGFGQRRGPTGDGREVCPGRPERKEEEEEAEEEEQRKSVSRNRKCERAEEG